MNVADLTDLVFNRSDALHGQFRRAVVKDNDKDFHGLHDRGQVTACNLSKSLADDPPESL